MRKATKHEKARELEAIRAEERRVQQESDALRAHQEQFEAEAALRAAEQQAAFEAEQRRLQQEAMEIEEKLREAAAMEREETAKQEAMLEVCQMIIILLQNLTLLIDFARSLLPAPCYHPLRPTTTRSPRTLAVA